MKEKIMQMTDREVQNQILIQLVQQKELVKTMHNIMWFYVISSILVGLIIGIALG